MVEDPLVHALSDETSMPPQDVQRVLSALATVTQRQLDDGQPVEVPGVGVWRTGPTGAVHVQVDPALSRTPVLPPWWNDAAHTRARRVARTLVADLELYRPEGVPQLSPEMPDDVVHHRCSAAFGPWWHEAHRAFVASVEEGAMSRIDHLVDTARQRWSTDATG